MAGNGTGIFHKPGQELDPICIGRLFSTKSGNFCQGIQNIFAITFSLGGGWGGGGKWSWYHKCEWGDRSKWDCDRGDGVRKKDEYV